MVQLTNIYLSLEFQIESIPVLIGDSQPLEIYLQTVIADIPRGPAFPYWILQPKEE